jgi:hypothetical protein
MISAPRIVRLTLAGLAVVGRSGSVLAGGLLPGNGGSITLTPLPLPPAQGFKTSSDSYSDGNSLGQMFGVHNSTVDFVSMRPDDNSNFKPLLRGGVGDGGLQLQLKW